MAYNNFGAMVWCDGELVNESHADVALFDRQYDGLGGGAIFAQLAYTDGRSDVLSNVYHAVLGDGDIRVGIYKMNRIVIVRLNDDGGYELLYDGGLSESGIINTFNVPDKYVAERVTLGRYTVKNLFTKMWLGGHRFERKHTKAMRKKWGGKRVDAFNRGLCLWSKHQKDWARKPKKKVNLGMPRIRKGKSLLPDGMWFSANLGGVDVHIGIDEFMRINHKESSWDYAVRFAVELDSKMWTCRVGCAYGNGWEGNEEIPDRLYEAVTYSD